MFPGSAYPYISFKYACGPFVKWRYIFTALLTAMTIICIGVSLVPNLLNSMERRAGLFVCFFACCFFPILMIWIWYDPLYMLNPEPGLCAYPIYMYVGGILFYIARFPECCSKTGKFDFCGASHQIFHCWILAAVALSIISL